MQLPKRAFTYLEVARLAVGAGFSDRKAATQAVAIASAESSRRWWVEKHYKGHVYTGLMQVGDMHGYDHARLLDPAGNMQAAFAIAYSHHDNVPHWSPWETFTTKTYVPYLPAASAAVTTALKEQRTGKDIGRGLFGHGGGTTPAGKDGAPYGPDYTGVVPGIGYVPGQAEGKALWDAITKNPLAMIAAFFVDLLKANTWIRIAEALFGAIFLLAGIAILARELGANRTADAVQGLNPTVRFVTPKKGVPNAKP